MERFLGLDQNDRAFRLDGGFRLTRNYRHAIEFSWFQLNRDGTNLAPDDIELPGDPDIRKGR